MGLVSRGLFVAAALAVAFTLGATAPAANRGGETAGTRPTVFVNPNGRPMPARWQRWARNSLVPLVEGKVRIHLDGCPARPRAVACIYTKRRRTVYIDRGRAVLPATLYHELGHLFDLRVLNNRERRRFKRIVDRPRRPWYGGSNPTSEQFGEAYAFCARYRRIRSVRKYAVYGYDPTPAEHQAACRLIRRAAAPRGRPPQPAPNTPPATSEPNPPPQQPPDDPDHEPGGPLPPLPPLPGPELP